MKPRYGYTMRPCDMARECGHDMKQLYVGASYGWEQAMGKKCVGARYGWDPSMLFGHSMP